LLLLLAAGLMTGREAYDVVVAGAGCGGVAAAIAAARMGASVALLEETDWIGGQATAAGVSTMDEAGFNTTSGFFAEFTDRVRVHYARLGKSVGTCASSPRKTCFEPSVGRRILQEMIDDTRAAGGVIDLHLRTRVTEVAREGNRITGVTLSGGRRLGTKVLIEATEYGDVLPLTGEEYRAGRYLNEVRECCLQDITYTAVVKRYPGGVPKELWMDTPPPGYGDEARARFRKFVAAEGKSDNSRPWSWARHNSYRGVPDSAAPGSYTRNDFEKISKTGVNNANDYAVTTAIFDRTKRREIECGAKLLTLQFLYYMQHDLGQKDWAIANDEGYDTAYNREENRCAEIPEAFRAIERQMPVMPYVRESFRMVGMHTYAAPELQRTGTPPTATRTWKTAIAVGDYPMDLHACDREEDLESGLEKLSDRPANFMAGLGPFQVPWEVLVARKIDGLLAAEKNVSVSRLVAGAVRLQPIAMLLGQAAGVTAGIAVKRGVAPRAVPVALVQRELLERGNRLTMADFVDVNKQNVAWAAVQLAVVNEWLVGDDGRTFGLDRPLLHGQMAGLDGPAGQRVTVAEFAEAMRRRFGRETGIEVANPRAGLTRGQAAMHLYRLVGE
jgi:choline dehydrogenase-like flavoprotein